MNQIKKIKIGNTYYSMLPEGGTAGQILKKNSATDFDTVWGNIDLSDSNMESVTYYTLVSKATNSQLIPGKQYRITDYTCIIGDHMLNYGIKSNNHQFDIIVTADSENTLNENARATHHIGDTYFQHCILEAWELKYSLNVDNTDCYRFMWADPNNNSKGLIYYMKDEFGNECGYDFKNIQFTRFINNDGRIDDNGGSATYVYTFTRYDIGKENIEDASVPNTAISSGANYLNCSGNIIKSIFDGNNDTPGYQKYSLNDIVFINFYYPEGDIFYECKNNIFGNGCHEITIGSSCSNNTFGNNCYRIRFGSYCSNNTFGNNCNNIQFYDALGGELLDYYENITVESGNQYINLNNPSAQETSSSNKVMNIKIAPGLSTGAVALNFGAGFSTNQRFQTVFQPDDSTIISVSYE